MAVNNIDINHLKETCEGLGMCSEELIDMFNEYIIGNSLSELKIAAKNGDIEDCKYHSHIIKSQCRNLGLFKCSKKAETIELLLEKNNSERGLELSTELVKEVQEDFKTLIEVIDSNDA